MISRLFVGRLALTRLVVPGLIVLFGIDLNADGFQNVFAI